jgi:transposase-like protein
VRVLGSFRCFPLSFPSLTSDEDFVRAAVKGAVQAMLEAEMTEAIGADEDERSATRVS